MDDISSNFNDKNSTMSFCSITSESLNDFTHAHFINFIKTLKQNYSNLTIGNFFKSFILCKFQNLGFSESDLKNMLELNYEFSNNTSSTYKENNQSNSINPQPDVRMNPTNWELFDVVKWLKKESLDHEQIKEFMAVKNISGEKLLNLTMKEMRERINSPKLCLRLYEAIQRLKIEIKNVNLICISQGLKEDIIRNDFDIISYPIAEKQLEICEDLEKEISSFRTSEELDKHYKRLYDIEEKDLIAARELNIRLNGENARSTTNNVNDSIINNGEYDRRALENKKPNFINAPNNSYYPCDSSLSNLHNTNKSQIFHQHLSSSGMINNAQTNVKAINNVSSITQSRDNSFLFYDNDDSGRRSKNQSEKNNNFSLQNNKNSQEKNNKIEFDVLENQTSRFSQITIMDNLTTNEIALGIESFLDMSEEEFNYDAIEKTKDPFTCDVCFEKGFLSKNRYEKVSNTLHCIDCLRSLVFTSMKDFTMMPPRVNRIELSNDLLDVILTKFERLNFQAKLQEFLCQNRFYCQNPTCSEFINLDLIELRVDFCCKACNTLNCLICRSLAHKSRDCAENLDIINNAKDKILLEKQIKQSGYKKCPKCRTAIELSTGCNHMTCRFCSNEFCFECLTVWNNLSGKCPKGCRLYSERVEREMLRNELDNRRLNGEAINNRIINHIRVGLRNRRECLHKNNSYIRLFAWSNCTNCGYLLKHYSFKCDDCQEDQLICHTCKYYRIR